ncbi:MBL fold metallo-hydrolase [Lysinibacillus sp. KU-BSD001]|uniref:MBL fold metallo-hydrolase n=1 Tax=Lysinibacillus sp. KU-BSD001 TaxID=3141328 RepID=UPI0036E27AEC
MNEHMNYGEDYKFIPMTSILSMVGQVVVPDIYCYTIQVVNICFIGDPSKNTGWTLIDAGMPKSANAIIQEAENRFGPNTKPDAILLTHGHFDHIGAIIELINHWNVPVYAHKNEIPYLTGQMNYANPDPTVGGGLVARMSPIFPNDAISLGNYVQPLPEDGSVPNLKDWKWLHTPGHSPGHVSFFRESDQSLIVGDAFVTVKQESLYRVLMQEKELSGPPKYLTTDWDKAWESVKKLEALKPAVAITGHGIPMSGEELAQSLTRLATNFDQLAIPKQGRYLN